MIRIDTLFAPVRIDDLLVGETPEYEHRVEFLIFGYGHHT